MKRDPEYAAILQRNNPREYEQYISKYNEWLASLPSSTNDYLEAKANGQKTFMIVDREFPVSQGEGSEEINEDELITEESDEEINKDEEIELTKEEKVQFLKFLKDNGMKTASMTGSEEAIDKNIAKLQDKAE